MTLIDMLKADAAAFPDKIAIVQDDRRITYKQFIVDSERLANSLLRAGLKKGDMVGVLLHKSPEVILSFLGIAMAGCIYVPIDHTQVKDAIQYLLDLTSPSALIADTGLWPVMSEVQLPCPESRIISVGGRIGPGCLDWDEIMSGAEPSGALPDVFDDDVVFLNFTSGTTGRPKGAVTTHANIYWNTLSAVETLGLTHEDVHLCMFPVFVHPHEFFARSLLLGGTAVLVDSVYPKSIARAISEHRVTSMMAVAPIYEAIMRQHELSRLDLTSLRVPESGGCYISPASVSRFQELFEVPIYPVWGSTETTGIALATSPGNCQPDSMGQPCRYYEVSVVDESGAPVPPGVVGEMRVRGPGVCGNYYRNADETSRYLQDGWFLSGDLVMTDERGFVYFVDRKMRMMKVAGLKVYPSEIERVLISHPGILEVAVTKVKDGLHGEVPKAYVVAAWPGKSIDRHEIRRFCEGKIAGHKIPRLVEIVDALPKTAGGKVLYSKLEM